MSAAVDVVIVNYRSAEWLRRSLASLRAHARGPAQASVYMVDNASGDSTPEIVAAEFPEVELIENPTNRGFAAATNQGIRAGAAALVLVLNPDAALHEGTLETLIATLEANPRAAVVGPRLVRPDGSLDHAAKRSFPTVLGALGHFTGLAGRTDGGRLAQYTAPEVEAGPVDAINGAFMLIRREALDDVGLFDEGYWMYMEDLDLCYRFKQAGWETLYEPRATATHLKGGSSGEIRSVRLNAWFHYGMFRFYRKFYAPERPWPANVSVYAGIAVKLGVSVLGGWFRLLARRLRP